MAKRSYHQRCALALALDQVGERWTLLLVRELLSGPKRYRDLLAGLPGIGTNLLAARLRDLEAAGLVERDPEGYRLTPRGVELEEAVVALARFGAPLLADADPGGHWQAHWNVIALQYAFRPERARKVRAVLEYRVDGTCVQARVREGTIETAGEERWKPDLVIRTDGETLLGLAAGEVDPRQAEAAGALELDGDRKLFRASLRFFEVG